MTVPNFAGLILDRMVLIDAELPQITIKGVAHDITVLRVTHPGSLAQHKLPIIYNELKPATTRFDANNVLIMERDCIKWLIIAPLAQEQDTSNGAQSLIDAYAAETVLFSHYIARPRLQVSSASPTPLARLVGGSDAVLITNFGTQVLTREIPPDRKQERWVGIPLTLRITMQYALEDGLLG